MSIFVDTSAFFALLDTDADEHRQASEIWLDLVESADGIVSSSYVLLETVALIQRRLGMAAVAAFEADIVPMLSVAWLGANDHSVAMQALLTAGRRQLSLVDCTSFETMRRLGIDTAFTLDQHFAEQGFDCLPQSQPLVRSQDHQ